MSKKLTVYYAHCQSIYGTPQELRDITLLKALGFEVTNPSDREIVDVYHRWLEENPDENKMLFWEELAKEQDVLAFRALPDGRIPQGVFKEINAFDGPVFELPFAIHSRELDLEGTREYLRLVGQR